MSDKSSYPGKKEMKWEPEYTEFLKNTVTGIPTSTTYEELKAKHESLKY